MKKFSASLLALSIATSFAAQAEDSRFIIQVDNQGKGIVKALAKQLGGDLKTEGNQFVAVRFEGKSLEEVKGLMNNPHVTLVEEDFRRKPMSVYSDSAGNPNTQQVTPYSVIQSQADQVAFNAQAGIKVCVIDSGLDRSNTDFNWGVITGDNDPGTGNWDSHGGPHGTHVAGTIGAADNNIGVVGMAPGVDMHIIKVFNESGWGYSSDLAAAADKCAAAGANIISMSLGGGGATTAERTAFESFTAAGGLAIAAAGNDANDVRSYPAGYSSVMMVGANDSDNNIASFSQFPSCESGRGKQVVFDESICVEVTAGGVGVLSTYPAGMATLSSLTADAASYESSAMENGGTVSGNTYFMGTAEAVDGAANGRICVIDRGNISFHDKVLNCENSGGIGAVIINNESGMLYGTLGDTNSTTIPAVGVTLEDRAALLAASNMAIDISAGDYGFMDGTSMATPAVSGVAALIWSNNTDCTGTQIRDALKATAEDSGAAGHDVYFGYGIVKAAAANAYLATNGCGGGSTGGGDVTLSTSGYSSKGKNYVDLTWSGASTSNVDVYRDGALLSTVSNSGAYTDSLGRSAGTFVYKVCEDGSTTACSAEKTVSF